jgi:hypothetical protein
MGAINWRLDDGAFAVWFGRVEGAQRRAYLRPIYTRRSHDAAT